MKASKEIRKAHEWDIVRPILLFRLIDIQQNNTVSLPFIFESDSRSNFQYATLITIQKYLGEIKKTLKALKDNINKK